jgi:NADPH-dependent ferric siderophore reductase
MSDAPAFRRPTQPIWDLTVVEAAEVTPRMRRVTVTGALQGFQWRPAQDLVLMLPQADGETARRHYTIRSFDPRARRLDIDFVLHGDAPAVRWARGAKPGDVLQAQGPRGRTVINPDAEWHLFTGDETCLPGIFAMIEQLPADARAFAFIEIESDAEKQAIEPDCELRLTWLVRDGPIERSSPRLIAALADFQAPRGRGHAYVIGETSTVRAQRQGLIAKGWDKAAISAEGYWRPGRVGGHDHVFDAEDMRGRMARA